MMILLNFVALCVPIVLFYHRAYGWTALASLLFFFGDTGRTILAILGILSYLGYRLAPHKITPQTQKIKQLPPTKQIPCLDLLVFAALRYEPFWHNQKMNHVQTLCSQITHRKDLIQQRMLLQPRPSLTDIINRLHKLNLHENDRIQLLQYALILTLANEPLSRCRSDLLSLSEDLNVPTWVCANLMAQMNNPQHEQNHKQKQHDNHQQKHTENHNPTPNTLAESAAILGVSIHASVEEINKAYRQKIHDYHPDRNPNVTEAVRQLLHEKSLAINLARDELLKQKK